MKNNLMKNINAENEIKDYINTYKEGFFKLISNEKYKNFIPKGWRAIGVSEVYLVNVVDAELVDGLQLNSISEINYVPTVVHSIKVPNNSSVAIEKRFKIGAESRSIFSFGFTQGLSTSASFSIGATIKLVELSSQFSVQLDIGANQQWTHEETKTWEEEVVVSSPPHSSIEAKTLVKQANFDTQFTGDVKIKEAIVHGFVKVQLDHKKNVVCKFPFRIAFDVTDFKKEFVYPIKGTLGASLGLESYTSVDDIKENVCA